MSIPWFKIKKFSFKMNSPLCIACVKFNETCKCVERMKFLLKKIKNGRVEYGLNGIMSKL